MAGGVQGEEQCWQGEDAYIIPVQGQHDGEEDSFTQAKYVIWLIPVMEPLIGMETNIPSMTSSFRYYVSMNYYVE